MSIHGYMLRHVYACHRELLISTTNSSAKEEKNEKTKKRRGKKRINEHFEWCFDNLIPYYYDC